MYSLLHLLKYSLSGAFIFADPMCPPILQITGFEIQIYSRYYCEFQGRGFDGSAFDEGLVLSALEPRPSESMGKQKPPPRQQKAQVKF